MPVAARDRAQASAVARGERRCESARRPSPAGPRAARSSLDGADRRRGVEDQRAVGPPASISGSGYALALGLVAAGLQLDRGLALVADPRRGAAERGDGVEEPAGAAWSAAS